MATIRRYKASDKQFVIELLRENTPHYFDKTEEDELSTYLESEVEDYFVTEEEGKLISAGGINYFHEEKKARLAWDMVHPSSQGCGLGTRLVRYRLDHISSISDICKVEVRTSQIVFPFYEKMGFEVVHIRRDYWAVGYDLYHMELVEPTNG